MELSINSFLEFRLLRESQSEFNTPILPVKRPKSSEYRLAEDLWEINAWIADVCLGVLNPNTLLASIPETNLKDATFYIPVDEQSQLAFAFEWENPTTGQNM